MPMPVTSDSAGAASPDPGTTTRLCDEMCGRALSSRRWVPSIDKRKDIASASKPDQGGDGGRKPRRNSSHVTESDCHADDIGRPKGPRGYR